MSIIWCAISGHGYGHAAQVLSVLNELAGAVTGLKAVLRTAVPAKFFEDRLDIPWELSPAEQDIGCAQEGPLHIRVAETWAEHQRFHEDWDAKVKDEAASIRSMAPSLVLSDISYLAIEASARAHVPSVALCNLSWDAVLEPFSDPGRHDQARILNQIRRAYARADLILRPHPGIPMNAFQKVLDIGPIHQLTKPQPQILRHAIGAASDDTIVLVAFGGVPLTSLPAEQMESLAGFRFIVSGPVPHGCRLVHPAASVPLSFSGILASVDIVMTKPGYSTIVEAVGHGKPILYVRRYNFSDEASLVQYIHQHGRGIELSAPDFAAGRWRAALQALIESPPPSGPEPPPTGTLQAAKVLASYF